MRNNYLYSPKIKVTNSYNHTMDEIKEGDFCKVIAGTHKGKEGILSHFNISKTGNLTVTVTQKDEVRFKTLGKNVEKIYSPTAN